MLLKRFFTPGLSINSYLIFDEETRHGAIIDPTQHVESYLSQAIQEGVEITDIIETHVHADFVSGSLKLKTSLYNKPTIHCSGMGGKEWIPHYTDHIVYDHDTVNLGNIRLKAMHTPGHTPEHLIWLAFDEQRNRHVAEMAFTGDLLFVGGVGRPDLLGHKIEEQLAQSLYHSLFERIDPLPDFLEIFPAHGAGSLCGKAIGTRSSTTLGYERRCNPWLIPQKFSPWYTLLQQDIPLAPGYFQRIKHVNITGLNPAQRLHAITQIIAQEDLKKYLSSCLTVDTRKPEAFAARHFKGAINIPLAPAFALWTGTILPEDKELLFIVDHPEKIVSVLQALRLVGLNRVIGFWNVSQPYSEEDVLTTSSPMITVEMLKDQQKALQIIDVRTPSEWRAGHIKNAYHMELAAIPQAFKQLPRDRPMAIICQSGNRASIAASFLTKEGVNAKNVQGGMQAWSKADDPISTIPSRGP